MCFSQCAGLRINFSITQMIWIGSKIDNSGKLKPKCNLQWGKSNKIKNKLLVYIYNDDV